METRIRIRRRRRTFWQKHNKKIVLSLGILIVAFLALKEIRKAAHEKIIHVSELPLVAGDSIVAPESLAQESDGQESSEAMAARTDSRRIYPYSVVPGGVASIAELRRACERDSLVHRHYAGMDWSKARFVRSSEMQLAYVSYRKEDQIYWTKKKVALKRGELLISDGKTTSRGRCANQISAIPKLPTILDEPEAGLFDIPLPEPDFAILSPISLPAALMSLPSPRTGPFPVLHFEETPKEYAYRQSYPHYPQVRGRFPRWDTPTNNVTPVPEPSTFWLLASGLGGAWFWFRTKLH